MVVLFALVALAVVGLLSGVHWYLWRRLVRDTTACNGDLQKIDVRSAAHWPRRVSGA